MIQRMSVLLTPEECQDLHMRLITPEKDINEEMDKLSEENNVLTRRRREIVTGEQCIAVLQEWLQTQGDTMYWDQLSRTLRLIGRSDVARELGKNLNQDKNLEIKKYVEGYEEKLEHQKSTLLLQDEEKYGEAPRRTRDVSEDENWEDWELIIEREKLPPYNRSMSEWCTPVIQGIIFGFLGAALVAALVIKFTLWISNQDCIEIMRLQRFSHFQHPRGTLVYSSSEDSDDGDTWS